MAIEVIFLVETFKQSCIVLYQKELLLLVEAHWGWLAIEDDQVGQGPHGWERLCVCDCRGTRMSVAYPENKRGVYSLVGTIKQIRKVL